MELCDGALALNIVMPLPDGGKSLKICAFVSIKYQSVTDRFAIRISRSAWVGSGTNLVFFKQKSNFCVVFILFFIGFWFFRV